MYVAIPFAVFSIICLIVSLILIKENTNKPDTNINLGNPMNLLNAIGFGVIYVVILFAVFYSNQYFGESGLYYSALIAGLADTDAITISLAKFASDTEKIKLASSVIVTAVMSNMLVKLGIALFKGSKVTGKLVSYTFASIIVIGVLYAVIAN